MGSLIPIVWGRRHWHDTDSGKESKGRPRRLEALWARLLSALLWREGCLGLSCRRISASEIAFAAVGRIIEPGEMPRVKHGTQMRTLRVLSLNLSDDEPRLCIAVTFGWPCWFMLAELRAGWHLSTQDAIDHAQPEGRCGWIGVAEPTEPSRPKIEAFHWAQANSIVTQDFPIHYCKTTPVRDHRGPPY